MGDELILKLLIMVTGALVVLAVLDRLIPFSANSSPVRVTYRGLLFTLLPLLIAVLMLRSFVVEPFRIPSSSMEPGLVAGDYILVNKYRYGLRLPLTEHYLYSAADPQRGDVAVFFPPGDNRYFIKRVVGVPGDLISYRDKELSVNGRRVYHGPLPVQTLSRASRGQGFVAKHEQTGKYAYAVQVHKQAAPQNFEVQVSPGHYFLMGDNRDNSRDSRVWGEVARARFVGPAVFVWMHWRGFGTLPDFSRIGTVH